MLKNGIFPNGTPVPKTKEEMEWALDNDYIIPDFRDGKWSVEKLLDNADVKLEWFVPSATAFEFFNFIRLVLGEEPENTNPPAHYFLIDAIFGEDSVEPYYKVRNIPYRMLKDRVAVMAHREFSKALTLDTLIATPDGYKKNKDIKVGDYVISRTGKPTRVIAKSKIFNDPVYRLTFEDGRTIECCEDHQHILINNKGNEFVCDTKFIANNIDKEQYSIPSFPIGSYIKLKSIKKIDTVPTQCISVECPTKSFVLGNGLITHNSTLIGSFLPLFIAHKGSLPGFGRIGYMLYVADSIENNVKTTMQTIGSVFKESLFLNERFEASHLTNESVKFVRKPSTDYEMKLYNKYKKLGYKDENIPGRMKRTFVMDGFGVLSGVRGTREGLDRPKGAIFDDLIRSEKDAQSNAILEKANSTIDADVLKGLNQNGNFAILIGTPYNKKDPVYKRIDGGSWLPIVFPKADKIGPDLTKEEFRGSWEDRHTYEKQMKELRLALRDKENGDPKPYRRLMQEFYLRITDDEDKVVDLSWFETDIDRKDILAHSQNYRFYMTTDFTTTGKRGSDYSAMMLWALDYTGTFYLIDLFVKKVELEEQYNKVIDMIERVKPFTPNVEVGVETDGQQKAHIFALKKVMKEKGVNFTFARQKGSPFGSEGISSRSTNKSKHERFMLTLPMMQGGKIKFTNYIKELGYKNAFGDFVRYYDELEEELSLVTSEGFNSTNDDALDCISMLNQMETYTKAEPTEDKKNNSVVDDRYYPNRYYEDEDGSIYDNYT